MANAGKNGLLAKAKANKELIILILGFLGVGGYEGFKPRENVDVLSNEIHALEHENQQLHKENQILIDGYNAQSKEIQEDKKAIEGLWGYIDENSGKWNSAHTTSQRNAGIIDKHH